MARRLAPGLIVMALTVSCGSTVQDRTVLGGDARASQTDLGGSGGAGNPGLDGSTSVGLGSGNGTGGASTPGPVASPGAADPGTVGPGGGTPTARPKVAPKGPVKIGFIVVDGADTYFAALGQSGATTGDQRNQVRALVSYVNKHGGLVGHQIEPVMYSWSLAAPAEQENAAACQYFTQDHPVFAVVDTGTGPGFVSCVTRAGVLDVQSSGGQSESTIKQAAGRFFDPPDMTPERFAREYIAQLAGLGFLTPGAKLGLLTWDSPDMKRVTEQIIKPALRARGFTLTDEAAMDEAGYASQGPSFAFRFKASGVTHVLNMAQGAIVPFQIAAERQQYRPRYALSSRDGPGAWVQAYSPAEQLYGSVGIGWQPLADVDLKHSPGDVSPNQTLCRKLFKEAGEDMSIQLVQVASHRYCEGVFFMTAVAARMQVLSMSAFATAAAGIGTAYQPVLTFRSFLSTTRFDGPDQIRPFSFQTSCNCFTYSGPARNLAR